MRDYGLEGNSFLRVLVFILAFLTALPAIADDTIFRNFVWGASKADVRAFEKAKFYKEEEDSLFFVEQPDPFRRLIRYDFRDGKLWGARYEYQELEIPNSDAALNMYVDLERVLEAEYGTPAEEKFIWKNKTYRNFPRFWARAFGSGDLKMEAVWQVNDTAINLQSFYDGTYYQLFYTLELAGKDKIQNSRGILNIPAVQKNAPDSKP